MNQINTNITSAFLKSLEPDKSLIKTVTPLVIFRRILGVSEQPTARDIVAALQMAATRIDKLNEFQKNFSSPSLIGEIMTFDIGPAQQEAWMKFSVLREPLAGEENKFAINFAVIVTDRKNGKRYNRVIGAMQREATKDGRQETIFRMIKDICNVEEIEKEASQDGTVIAKGIKCVFHKQRDEIVIFNDDDGAELTRLTDPDIDNVDCSVDYIANCDVKLSTLKTGTMSEIMECFDRVEPPEEVKKPEPKKEEEQPEQKEELPTEHADQPQPSEQQEPDNAGESDPEIVVHKDEMVNFDTGNGTKLYKSKGDYTQAQVTDIVQSGKIDEFFDEQLPPPPDEIPAKDLDEHEEENEQESDEETHDDSKPAETQEEAAPSEETHDDAEAGAEAALKDSETENKEKKEMEDEIVYHAGDTTTFFGDPNTYRIKCDVTRAMLNEKNGNVADFAEIVQPEQPAAGEQDATVSADGGEGVGEIPDVSLVKDEHTKGDYLRMLFKTATPSIMHVFSILRQEAGNDTFKATGCWPIEQMIAFPTYSFSIVKMKNGRFYRIFVAHTDKDNLANSTWLETKDVKDRWLELCDVQDREIGRILDARERR